MPRIRPLALSEYCLLIQGPIPQPNTAALPPISHQFVHLAASRCSGSWYFRFHVTPNVLPLRAFNRARGRTD
jgi:hypothetical protein